MQLFISQFAEALKHDRAAAVNRVQKRLAGRLVEMRSGSGEKRREFAAGARA